MSPDPASRTASPDGGKAGLSGLLADASVEISPRNASELSVLRENFAPGTRVHVTFLPDDDYRRTVDMAAELRRAGFDPVPHVPARSIADSAALDDYLARAAGEAGVGRVLLIAGDVDRPRGPFAASLDVLKTGLLQRHGIGAIAMAGHPEGHPSVAAPVMAQALADKVASAADAGLAVTIITQFCFEARPILNWLSSIRAAGIGVPVRIGVAAPASAMSLVRYGLRCGVGNSLRALRTRAGKIGALAGDVRPDPILADVAGAGPGALEGIHLYVFGGLKKAGQWYGAAQKAAIGPQERTA